MELSLLAAITDECCDLVWRPSQHLTIEICRLNIFYVYNPPLYALIKYFITVYRIWQLGKTKYSVTHLWTDVNNPLRSPLFVAPHQIFLIEPLFANWKMFAVCYSLYENVSGKLRQGWWATAGTNFTTQQSISASRSLCCVVAVSSSTEDLLRTVSNRSSSRP